MRLQQVQQDVLDALHDGLVVQDANGEIVYANPAAERILGLAARDLVGLTSKDPRWEAVDVNGAPVPDDEHPIVTVRTTGRPVRDFLMSIRRSDGERRWVEINAMPLVDEPGSPPVGAVAVFSDVTDELAAKRALRVSEERFRTAVETMLDGFMLWRAVRDDEDRIVDFVCEFANAAVGASGYGPSEVIGRRLHEIAPRLAQEPFDQYVAVVETGEPLRLEVPWYEGTRIRGAFAVSAVRMGDGVALTYRDVTEQREHEQALRESEEQTRRFLEAIPMGVAIVEPGNVVFTNEALRRILGDIDIDTDVRGPELIEHFGLRRAETDEPYPFDELPLARAIFAGETTIADDIVITRDGRDVPVEGFAAPVRDSAGEVRWALTLLNDITERRLQDLALAEAVGELGAINEELDEFAAIAAHDLAAPLIAIAGLATLLEETYGEALDPRGQEWVRYVLAESERMRAFIDELLAYSRAGAQSVAAAVDLADVATTARDALRAGIDRTGASVEIGELPVVTGDPTALGQVLQNLIGNALKFGVPGEPPTVRVDSVRDGGQWIVAVADDGIGVEESERDRIFSAFHRAPGAPHDVGHGLGLSICRRIVERHGGRIWVEPHGGGGSRFCFSLPADG